ncbi:MAG: helical backbone metal receptor, partial [Candidatus Latescibacteria bacterium]|nr:helical backbone metal receptor [Candidatus Latescibacterota bacterium]
MRRPFVLLVVLLLCLEALPVAASQLPALVDALGDTLHLPDTPRRIVSLAPSNTEIAYAVGAGDRLVGVTGYCNYPPEAGSVKTIGGFSDPNLELIVSLRPDLVLGARFNPLEVLSGLRRLDIPVFVLAPE